MTRNNILCQKTFAQDELYQTAVKMPQRVTGLEQSRQYLLAVTFAERNVHIFKASRVNVLRIENQSLLYRKIKEYACLSATFKI